MLVSEDTDKCDQRDLMKGLYTHFFNTSAFFCHITHHLTFVFRRKNEKQRRHRNKCIFFVKDILHFQVYTVQLLLSSLSPSSA
jgi:hypothetical protein